MDARPATDAQDKRADEPEKRRVGSVREAKGYPAEEQAGKLASQLACRRRGRTPLKRATSGDNALVEGAMAVEAYLARVPEPARTTLAKVRAMNRAATPKEATEQLSYGMLAFRYKGALVAYAAFKLPFLSHAGFVDRRNAGRSEGLPHVEGDAAVPGGPAATGGASEEDGEGACGGE